METHTHPDKLSVSRRAVVDRLRRHHTRTGERLLGPRGRNGRTEWVLVGADGRVTRRWPDGAALERHARAVGVLHDHEVVS